MGATQGNMTVDRLIARLEELERQNAALQREYERLGAELSSRFATSLSERPASTGRPAAGTWTLSAGDGSESGQSATP